MVSKLKGLTIERLKHSRSRQSQLILASAAAIMTVLLVWVPFTFVATASTQSMWCENYMMDTICNVPFTQPIPSASTIDKTDHAGQITAICEYQQVDWQFGTVIEVYAPCGGAVAKTLSAGSSLCDWFPWASVFIEIFTAGQGC